MVLIPNTKTMERQKEAREKIVESCIEKQKRKTLFIYVLM